MALDAENLLEVDPLRDDGPSTAPPQAPAPPPVVVVQYQTRRLPWILLALLLLAVPLGAYVMYQHMLSRIRDYAEWGAREELRRARELEQSAAKLAMKPSTPAAATVGPLDHPDEKPGPKSNAPGPVSTSNSKTVKRPALANGRSPTVEKMEQSKPAAPGPGPTPVDRPASNAPPPAPAAPIVAVASPPATAAEDPSARIFHDLVPEEEDLAAFEFGGRADRIGGKAAPILPGPPSPEANAAPAPADAPAPASPKSPAAPASSPAAASAVPAPGPMPDRVPPAMPLAPNDPSPFEPAEEAPLPSKEEIERQIRAEAAAKQMDLGMQALDKSREIERAKHEERLRFHRELGEILAVQGSEAGPYIDELCRRFSYQASAERFHKARLAWDHGGGSLTRRASRVRSFGLPETVILSFLEKDLDPLIGTPGGPRNQNEVRLRAARAFLKRCKPPPLGATTPTKRSPSGRSPGAAAATAAAPRGRRSP